MNTLTRVNLSCHYLQNIHVTPHRGESRAINLCQKLYSGGFREMERKVVSRLAKVGARTPVESIANLIPLHDGDWILVQGDKFVGVQLIWGDQRVRIKPCASKVDLNNPWDQYLIGDAKRLIFSEVQELAEKNDLEGLREEAGSFIRSRHFDHDDSPFSIPGFGNLDIPGGLFVPFFRNGTTPEKSSQFFSEKRRYSVELGGGQSQKRKIWGMWATRLWDYDTDHEVIGSRIYSWDLESAVSAAVCMAEELEGHAV